MKPNAFLPRDALSPLELKWVRPWTKQALWSRGLVAYVSLEWEGGLRNSRHQRGGDNLEHPCEPGKETREIASNPSADGHETEEERASRKEERYNDERKHEPRHQKVVLGSKTQFIS